MPAERLAVPSVHPSQSRAELTGWARWAYLPLLITAFAGIFILYLLDSGAGVGPADGEGLPGIRIRPDAPAGSLLSYGLIGASLLSFTLAIEPFFRSVTGIRSRWTHGIPFAALAGLPPWFVGSTPGDLPALALTTLGLLALVRRRWAAYGLVLALAAVNRWTAVLLPVAFGVHSWTEKRMGRRRILALLLAQWAAVLMIRRGVTALGPAVTAPSVMSLANGAASWLRSYRMETAVAWTALLVAVAVGWNEKPVALKAVLAAGLLLMAGGAFLGGTGVGPVYETYPVVLVLCLHPFLGGPEAAEGSPSRAAGGAA